MYDRPSLSLEDARFIADIVIDLAREAGFPCCVAVTDSTTFVQCHLRMDGAPLFAADFSLRKSATASEGGRSTAFFGQALAEGQLGVLQMRQVGVIGGVPVMVEGRCLGGVGVSGAPPELDQQWAEAAVAAFLGRLGECGADNDVATEGPQ